MAARSDAGCGARERRAVREDMRRTAIGWTACAGVPVLSGASHEYGKQQSLKEPSQWGGSATEPVRRSLTQSRVPRCESLGTKRPHCRLRIQIADVLIAHHHVATVQRLLVQGNGVAAPDYPCAVWRTRIIMVVDIHRASYWTGALDERDRGLNLAGRQNAPRRPVICNSHA